MAGKPVRKTIKRIIKLGGLIGIKEIYLLGRNLLGLIYHPFLTLRRIKKERDFSQTILVAASVSSPVIVVLIITLAAYLVSHFFFPLPDQLKQILIAFNLAAFLISGAAILYLLYWSFQVIRKNHFRCHV